MTTNGRDQMNPDRYEELKRILEERRREMLSEVHEKMRDVRTEGGGALAHGVLDAAESSETDIQDDIEFALLQMKAETLTKIGESAVPFGGRFVRVLLRVCGGNCRATASAPCRSRCGARTARKPAKWRSNASGFCRSAAGRPHCSPTSRVSETLRMRHAPPSLGGADGQPDATEEGRER